MENNIIDVNNSPFSFTGRIERLPYLYTKIGLVCFWFLLIVFMALYKTFNIECLQLVAYIIKLFFWVLCVFAASKRLRDINWSQWYLLFWFIPFVVFLAELPLFFIKSKYSSINKQ